MWINADYKFESHKITDGFYQRVKQFIAEIICHIAYPADIAMIEL